MLNSFFFSTIPKGNPVIYDWLNSNIKFDAGYDSLLSLIKLTNQVSMVFSVGSRSNSSWQNVGE
jgi:hypothetical protein